jgi:hypothetical protein
MKEKEPKMLTVKEAAARIGASSISVRIWAAAGRLPGAKKESSPIGEYWMIPLSAVDSFEMGKAGRPATPGSKRSRKKAS